MSTKNAIIESCVSVIPFVRKILISRLILVCFEAEFKMLSLVSDTHVGFRLTSGLILHRFSDFGGTYVR